MAGMQQSGMGGRDGMTGQGGATTGNMNGAGVMGSGMGAGSTNGSTGSGTGTSSGSRTSYDATGIRQQGSGPR